MAAEYDTVIFYTEVKWLSGSLDKVTQISGGIKIIFTRQFYLKNFFQDNHLLGYSNTILAMNHNIYVFIRTVDMWSIRINTKNFNAIPLISKYIEDEVEDTNSTFNTFSQVQNSYCSWYFPKNSFWLFWKLGVVQTSMRVWSLQQPSLPSHPSMNW